MAQSPGRPWTVYVLPSSHNDIGWAGTPSEIAEHRASAIVDVVLGIMERDPGYAFAMEAAVYLEEYLARRPERGPLIARFAREGRLEWGATYVQPYEGLLDGESLVRQVYWGRGWMRRRLGIDGGGYWNIDVAGRTPQLAQILARAGVEYTVLSRNEPGLYWWEALDGSRTLTMSFLEGAYVLSRVFSTNAAHFSPMEGRQAAGGGYRLDLGAVARELRPVLERWAPFFDERDLPRLILVAATADYAVPDERIRALVEHWNRAEPDALGLPWPVRLRFGNVGQYVEELRATADLSTLPVVRGEMPNPWVYIHGPCHHRTVAAMRAASDSLRKAEAHLSIRGLPLEPAERVALDTAWRDHLYPDHGYGGLHGEGTDEVFRARSEAAHHGARRLAFEAGTAVARRIAVVPGTLGNVVVFNALSWERDDWVEVEIHFGSNDRPRGMRLEDTEGTPVPGQLLEEARDAEGLLRRARLGFVARGVPSIGYRSYRLIADDSPAPSGPSRLERMLAGDFEFVGTHIRARITRGGILALGARGRAWLVDPDHYLGFEVVEMGSPGHDVGEGEHVREFDWRKVFPFQPTTFGVERTSDRSGAPHLLEDGPLRTRVTMESRFSHCTVRQTFTLFADLDRVDAEIDVLGWDGTHGREVRLLFPTREKADEIVYDVPFGSVVVGQGEYPGFSHLRPREVVSWISARFGAAVATLSTSVVAHDWDDVLAPGGRTVLQAVLLATKRSCHGRGPWYTQEGNHRFTASVTGHAATRAERTRFGLSRRHPLEAIVVNAGEGGDEDTPSSARFLAVDATNVVAAVKPAESGEGVVVRCCEVEGEQTVATLTLDHPVRARACDLLEHDSGDPPASAAPDRRVHLTLRPFEIATVRLI